jgi:hypothetical protein
VNAVARVTLGTIQKKIDAEHVSIHKAGGFKCGFDLRQVIAPDQ